MEGIVKFKKVAVAIVLSFVFGLTSVAAATDFNLTPASGTLGLNQEFSVHLHIDSSGATVNAAQATLAFPSNIIQIQSIIKDDSIFNFWLQDPEFSNDAGTISFIGGTPNGVSGSSLQVIKINFITKGVGNAAVSFIDGAITAADGQGTNVLGSSNGATFIISSAITAPPTLIAPGEEPAPVAPIIIPTPVPIIRQAIQVTGLPTTPQIAVSLYPDQNRWYNLISSFNVIWSLPPDISNIATTFNRNPAYVVPEVSEGLFDSKRYPEIQEDGVYYIHVRFKNNQGWGATAHYRIAVDTQPPLAFSIQVQGGVSSDDPTPLLIFQTGDALSGIENYLIQINQEEPIIVSPFGEETEIIEETEEIISIQVIDDGRITFLNVRSGPGTSNSLVTKIYPGEEFVYTEVQNNWYKIQVEDSEGWVFGDYVTVVQEGSNVPTTTGFISEYELPALLPGIYMVSIRAIDKAGNSVEDSVEIEVLPIDPPKIDFFTERILQKIEIVNVRGTAIPGSGVIIIMEDEDEVLILQNEVPVDNQGIWSFTLERTLRKGSYFITAKTRDSRGAVSFPTDPVQIRVTDKPIIVIGNIEFSLRDLVIIGIIIAAGVAIFFWRDTIRKTISLQRRSVIAAKDLRNALDMLKQAVINLQRELSKTRMNKAQATNAMNQVVKNLNKIDRYVVRDIEEIDR